MKFLIISHVEHTKLDGKIYGYGPYVKEMNLWLKYVDEVRIVAPLLDRDKTAIDLPYVHDNIVIDKVPIFNLVTPMLKLKTIFVLPYIFMRILWAMVWADHIHLRCPGNMGLLGAVAQILFPWKTKTAKYAGNWDPKSIQPRSYRIQKWILSNVNLTKNIKVLVYGQWKGQTKNIKSFFTATYHDTDKEEILPRNLDTEIKLLFVGTLSPGKQPLIAIAALKDLRDENLNARLDIMGEGVERVKLENYIAEHKLENSVFLHGNQNSEFVKNMFKNSHFLILMSKSEGWPKVVAEAMFWGCVPISSNVSCVEDMMGYGERGSLVLADAYSVKEAICKYIESPELYAKTSNSAQKWSRQYTLESFESAIKELLDV